MDYDCEDSGPDWEGEFDAEALAGDLADLDTAARLAPLALIVAWHTEHQTSQRRVLQALQDHKKVLACGGNRSGKTFVLICALVALALGSDHPHARQFWTNNGCDPDAFPKGPGEVCIVALSSGASLTYHRNAIDALLPQGAAHWWNKNSKGEARAEITVPGYDRPAIIWCKSEDQGEEAFQGASWRAVLHDEEGKTSKVYEEAGVRLIDQAGWQMMANTPIAGRTWVYKKFVAVTPKGMAYREIWTEDNPFLPPTAVEELRQHRQAAARLRGSWEVAEGLVYPQFSRARHMLDRRRWKELHPDIPWRPRDAHPAFPTSWPRYRSMDFGSTNPCAVLWGVRDPHGRVFLYRTQYETGKTMAWWAAEQKRARASSPACDEKLTVIRGEPGPSYAWADPAGAQEIRDLRGHGISFRPAVKPVRIGINDVHEYLEGGAYGPDLYVIEGTCAELLTEIGTYRWPDERGDGDEEEVPIKKHDHLMDCLRYLVHGIKRLFRLRRRRP